MTTARLSGPDGRYHIAIDLLFSVDGRSFTRQRATEGVPCWDTGAASAPGSAPGSARSSARSNAFLVIMADACSLLLVPGENGLMVRELKLLGASYAVATAVVTAGEGAPQWLPGESSYLLFHGDRAAASACKDRYIPLDGMAAERSWPEETTPLDSLALAVGRSVSRANAGLARIRSQGGAALVSSVTIRLAVDQTALAQGRLLVTLARPGAGESNQYVEFVLHTVPGAAEQDEDASPEET